MKNMVKYVVAVLFAFAGVSSFAQEEKRPFTVTLYGGIYLNNDQAWTVEPSVAWHFHKYIGVAFGMELTSQYNQPSRTTTINGHEASLADNEKNVAWIIFKTSVIFKSPNLLKNKDDIRLWFQAEPGISLACPFRNSLTYDIYDIKGNVGTVVDYMRFPNKGLDWFYWNARLSVNMSIDRFVIGAGYGISNLDYYSGRRNVTLQNGSKFWVPKKELSQSIFLSVGYQF